MILNVYNAKYNGQLMLLLFSIHDKTKYYGKRRVAEKPSFA